MLCIRKNIFTFVKVKKNDRFDLKNAVNPKKIATDRFLFSRFSHRKCKLPPPLL